MPNHAAELEDDPDSFLATLGANPLFINDAAFTPAVKRHNNDTNRELLKIMGRDRIAYASIKHRPELQRWEVDILPADADDSMPCYWLPWKKDAALQLKLKPSKKGTLDALPNHIIPTKTAKDSTSLELSPGGPWVDRGIEAKDPALFFTGMMNGCSLFVSGDSTEPLTYHVNRASFDQAGTAELLSSDRDRDKDINKLKSSQMVKDFKKFDNPGVFTKTARVTPSTQHRRNMLGNTAQDAATNERSRLIRGLIGGLPTQAYRIRGHWVTAFGVRLEGKWRFYKQDIYQYSKQDQYGNAVANSDGTAATRMTRFY